MNLNRTLFFRLFLLLICLNFACQKKEIETTKRTKNQDFFNSIRDSSDKMVIKLYHLKNPKVMQDLKAVVWEKVVSTQTKLDLFDSMFNNEVSGGYCCCPDTHYNITFYHKEKKIRIYNVDTSMIKNKALVFDVSYQTPYLIPLNKWNDFVKICNK